MTSDQHEGPTVLIVETSRVVANIAAKVCEDRGARVEAVENVGEAVTRVGAAPPTAVLTALELPGLTGGALIAALKSSPHHRAIPIGLITSTDSSHRHLGVYQPDAIITKDSALSTSVERFLESLGIGAKTEDGATTEADQPPLANVNILLCEDSMSIQALIGRILHTAGAVVVAATDGKQAVDLAGKCNPDLILMDIEMPEMDGREATLALRAKGVRTPIVALTAKDPEEFRPEAMELGFDDVLPKPLDRQVLIDRCAGYVCVTP